METTRFAAGSQNPRLFSGRRRTPPHPGLFLESRFLKPAKISQESLAKGLGVSRRRVNELIRGHRAITPDTAIRLGSFFGTGPEFWMNLQQAWDLFLAWRSLRDAAAGEADCPG
jgi:addiction module HigA family antidote